MLARITGARKGAIVDGFHDDDTCDRCWGWSSSARELATRAAACAGLPSSAATILAAARPREVGAEPAAIRATASRSSTIATC